MSQISQKDAVYNAVSSVFAENKITFVEGTDANTLMTKELRHQVNLILFESFRSNSVKLDRQVTDVELKIYVSGLQSNWLRKDKRLNGGIKYTSKKSTV